MWAKLKRQIWEWRGVLIAAPSVAALVIALRLAGFLQPLEWASYDQFLRLRPKEPPDDRIVIVGITESDLQKVGRGIVPDLLLAQLLQKIKQQQAIAIALDLYRDLPEEPGHQQLVRVYETTPNLIGIKKVLGDANGPAVNPPPQLLQRGQVSANDVLLDADLKLRRGFLYLTPKDGNTIESLGLRLALIYLKNRVIEPKAAKVNPNYLQLGEAVFANFEKNDGGYVNADDGGYQILINYRGPQKSFKTVSIMDVLENRNPPDLLRDRIVLIGAIAQSQKDFFSTPYSIPTRTSGVEIHANITSQIISAALDGRPLIKSLPDSLEYWCIFGWSLLGAILSWQARYLGGVAKFSAPIVASYILAGGSLFGIGYLDLLQGVWIPVVPPAIAFFCSGIAITAYIPRTAGEIRKTFGRYLTDEVVANLLDSPAGFKLGGERKKVTILMSDLRGFSAISERLSPETVVSMLNIYLGVMVDIITSYQGTIDAFIGDGILVIFGAPTQREDDAERAVACAVAMQLAMDSVNEKNTSLCLPKLAMGIGLNTGEAVVGNIGSQKHAKYSVIGSHVNLAARIESYTVGGQILISESTLKDVGYILKIDKQIQVQPKGFHEPIPLYDVAGIGGERNIFLTRQEENLILLKQEITVQYTVIDGKQVERATFKGSLVKLSANSAEIRSERLEPP
ncbi:CHASE2 domain-containing protein [Microseira sp. BLCC-F43]|jgi:adenylate cyclase|uniref:CHASE2 domain-containing protein n=1 Tax=Microseira sp. BLCC-F43 TaxID=3153602 RepID=UPI0035B85CCD